MKLKYWTQRMSISTRLLNPEGLTVLLLPALAEVESSLSRSANPANRLSVSVSRSRVSGTEHPERVDISTPPVIRPRSTDDQEREEFDAHLQSLVELRGVKFLGRLLWLHLRAKFA